ncbi:MAG TPA: hypothetical protein VFW23_14615 [Tepidisphaeraceae bacterium]|nr:hypothetical protein [Tepidisphaeraceae bacterium]
MLQASKDAESPRRGRWAFVIRLVVAIAFAAGINVLAVYGIVSALGTGTLPGRGLFVALTGTNICLLLLFTLLGETVIEDAVKALVTLLLSFALARSFKGGLGHPCCSFRGAGAGHIHERLCAAHPTKVVVSVAHFMM